jgi:hypothetical protein
MNREQRCDTIVLRREEGRYKKHFYTSLGSARHTSIKITSVFRIRIHRIHVFFGLPDPDPLVRGMDPDPDPALDPDPFIIMQKLIRKTFNPTIS